MNTGEKTRAVLDYSEHGTGTQGQLPQKCRKNSAFFKTMWKTPLF